MLDRFVGTWRGTYNSRSYTVKVKKVTKTFLGVTEETLEFDYEILEPDGTIFDSTFRPISHEALSASGLYLESPNSFYFSFSGGG